MHSHHDTSRADRSTLGRACDREPRLLIAQDRWSVTWALTPLFKRHGYEVVLVDDGQEAARRLVTGPRFDVALLDVDVPQMNGLEVLRQVREAAVTTAIVMVSHQASEDDKIAGFELGADDFVTHPVSSKELVTRVGAALRRMQPRILEPAPEVCWLGDVLVNFARHTVSRGNEQITLTPLEFKVLLHLARRRGRVVSRAEFKREVWDIPEEIQTRTMDRHIHALREKIEPDPRRPRYLKMVFGVGYRLEGCQIMVEPQAHLHNQPDNRI